MKPLSTLTRLLLLVPLLWFGGNAIAKSGTPAEGIPDVKNTALERGNDAAFEEASEAYRRQDYASAFAAFSTLANGGDARAQTVVAIMHKYGESVPVDISAAFNWYRKAAMQGYPPAQYNTGVMLAEGNGVTQNLAAAKTWLQQAADGGYGRAQNKLAELGSTRPLGATLDKPIAWSQRWNLRLPNTLRDETDSSAELRHQVYRIQLGAMSSLEAAKALWQQIESKHGHLLVDYPPVYRSLDTQAVGEAQSRSSAIVRLQIGPFNNQVEANRLCSALMYSHTDPPDHGCLVLKTH